MEKAKLRRSLVKKRKNMSVEEWREKSDRICSHLQSSPLFAEARTVLAYFSFRQEPDLSPLFTDNHTWGFPRCVDKCLSWHAWQPGEPLEKNIYGIFEPSADSPILKSDAVDLILVPAIACDERGYRLGYGGGFYDRLLSAESEWSSHATIGIIFEEAFFPLLPTEEWDRPLQAVCTEKGLRQIISDA